MKESNTTYSKLQKLFDFCQISILKLNIDQEIVFVFEAQITELRVELNFILCF